MWRGGKQRSMQRKNRKAEQIERWKIEEVFSFWEFVTGGVIVSVDDNLCL